MDQVDRVLSTPVSDCCVFHIKSTTRYSTISTAFKYHPVFLRLRISEIADFGKVDLVGSGGSFHDKPSVAVRVSGFITSVIAAGTGVLGVVFFLQI